jgi:hypothetical protein
LLDNTIITKDEPVTKKLIVESDIDTDRVFISFNEYWELDVIVNLLSYDNPLAKMNEIYKYKNHQVLLWKNRDGLPYHGNYETALFYIDEITPFNLDTFDFSDRLLIKFLQYSAGISKSASTTIQTEESFDIQTEDGQTIETE